MASLQADAPDVQEVSEKQAEKSTHENPVLEEKPATSEEAEVVVHDEEEDEEEEQAKAAREEEWQNDVKDEENVGSPFVDVAEPAASFDDEAEAEVEEDDMI